MSKASYVKAQKQTRDHHCHWPGCETQVPPAMWGCRPHWFALPKVLRDKIWAAYRPGQEISMTPSREYVAVANEVQDWIRDHLARKFLRENPKPKLSIERQEALDFAADDEKPLWER